MALERALGQVRVYGISVTSIARNLRSREGFSRSTQIRYLNKVAWRRGLAPLAAGALARQSLALRDSAPKARYPSPPAAGLAERYEKTGQQASLRRFLYLSAESEGFEPPERCRSTVFKTAAIDHSASSPLCSQGILTTS